MAPELAGKSQLKSLMARPRDLILLSEAIVLSFVTERSGSHA
jgi:hypothetical protein